MSAPTGTPDPRNRPRGGDGQFVRNPDTAARDAVACRMRRDGRTYKEIADELYNGHPGRAYEGVQRAMLAIVREPAEELRNFELDRLDYLYAKTLEVLHRRHLTVQHGKVVTVLNEAGETVTLEDDGPVLAAVQTLLKIQERRAKLLGLDAPKQIEIITLDAIQAEIRRLEESMAARERAAREAIA